MGKRYVVRLADPDRERAARLADAAGVPAQVRVRAAVLLAADAGRSDLQIATALATSVATVQRTRRRFAAGGFAAAVGRADPGGAADLRLPADLPGVVAVALVDYATGTCVGRAGGAGLDLPAAAACNAAVVRAKLGTIGRLSLPDRIEDILITLSSQYHLIRVLPGDRPLFLYAVLDRPGGNPAMARHRLAAAERRLADDLSGSLLP